MNPYEPDIQQAVATMRNHGVVLFPGDTIWGLGCDATDEIAIARLVDIKQRALDKQFVILMTDIKQLAKYIAAPPPNLEWLLQQFDQPTTVVYPHAINLPNVLIAEDGSIAIRLTKDPFSRSLIKRIRQPIISTSANFSGEPSPACFADIPLALQEKVDYVVNWRQEETEARQASAIMKLQSDGHFLKLR